MIGINLQIFIDKIIKPYLQTSFIAVLSQKEYVSRFNTSANKWIDISMLTVTSLSKIEDIEIEMTQ